MIEEILLFGAVLLAIGLVFASTLRTATPPLPTSPSVRKTLLAMLPSQVDGPVYELGSGWGGLAGPAGEVVQIMEICQNL